MEIKDIFISYKSEQFEDALWVKTQLEANGFGCWMAPMSITGGASYASEIPVAIQNCKVFVLILSSVVQTSKWVSRELDQAINGNKLILPFMVENCTLNDEFGFYLSNVQRYHAYADKSAAMEKMVADIRGHMGIPAPVAVPAPAVAPVAAPAPISQPKTAAKPEKKAKKPKKKLLGIVAAAVTVPLLLVALAVGGIVALVKGNKVEVAGNTYKKSAYSLTIENKTLTASDLAALDKFEDLGFVSIRNCTITADDLSALSRQDLNSLEMSYCDLTDAQLSSIDFAALERLAVLNLNGNDQLTDLSGLASLSDVLKELRLDAVAVGDTAWLADFAEMETLSLNHTGITHLDGLVNMVYLEYLDAGNNELSNLDGLIHSARLKTVSLSFNRLTDVSVLADSAATLTSLDVDHNELTNLSVLADCTALQYLSANDNQLTSVAFTQKMGALSTLYLSGNRITTLEGIAQSEKLTHLNLSHNALTAVEGLMFTSEWSVSADFSHNQIATVTLPTHCRYALLYLHDNPLQSDAFLAEIQGSQVSMDCFDALQASVLKEASFYNIYIIDCPVNRRAEIEESNNAVKLVTVQQLENPEA